MGAVRLKNWSIFNRKPNLFAAPETGTFHLQGNAYGHPNFNNGDLVKTSSIISITDKGDHKEAITQSGTVFALYRDDVDAHCEELYPGYYDRIKDVEMKR